MKLPKAILNQKIKDLGLIDENGKPISFAQFKQLVSVHQFGRGKTKDFILFIGQPKENLLAFYPMIRDNKVNSIKRAYDYLVDTITTKEKQYYEDDYVMWGNCGYPIAYGRIRANF